MMTIGEQRHAAVMESLLRKIVNELERLNKNLEAHAAAGGAKDADKDERGGEDK